MLRIVVPDLATFSELMMKQPAVPPRRCPHQDQHCPANGETDARPAARSPDAAKPSKPYASA
jgi:hypothetical protein